MQRVATARARGLLLEARARGLADCSYKILGLEPKHHGILYAPCVGLKHIWKLKLLGQTLGLLCSRSRCFVATALATACERNEIDLQ